MKRLSDDQLDRLDMIPKHNWRILSGFKDKDKVLGVPKGNLTILYGVPLGHPRLQCKDCLCIVEDQKKYRISGANTTDLTPWMQNKSYWERILKFSMGIGTMKKSIPISTSKIPNCQELIMENILK